MNFINSHNLFLLVLKEFYIFWIILFLFIFGYLKWIHLLLLYFSISIFTQIFTRTNLLYNHQNSKITKIISLMNLKEYKPPLFLPFRALQLIFLAKSKVKPKYKIKVERENIGDCGICIDWVNYENYDTNNNKILLVLPGLTGCIEDAYVINMVDKGIINHYKVGIYQMRILNKNVKLPQEQGKYLDLFEDLNLAIKTIKQNYGQNSKIYAIGYSYGANQLVRYLGDYNYKNHLIEAAVSISNPYDFSIASIYLEPTLFDRMILLFLQNAFKVIRESIDKDKKFNIKSDIIQNAISCRVYDKYFTTVIMGYSCPDDYYRNIGCARFIKNIDIPLLCIHAKDDCVTNYRSVPVDDIQLNSNIAFINTSQGNHSCFLESNGIFGVQQWVVKPAIDFIISADSLEN